MRPFVLGVGLGLIAGLAVGPWIFPSFVHPAADSAGSAANPEGHLATYSSRVRDVQLIGWSGP